MARLVASLAALALASAAAGCGDDSSGGEPAAPPVGFLTNCFDGSLPVPEPAVIVVACADAGVTLKGIDWSSWGSETASGTGTADVNLCEPTCADGKTESFDDVQVEVSRPQACELGPQYTRIEVDYGTEKPPGPRSLRERFPCENAPGGGGSAGGGGPAGGGGAPGGSGGGAGSGSAAGHRPQIGFLVNCYDGSPPIPEPLIITVDCADGGVSLRDLDWSSWGKATATATGTADVNLCEPSCAEGKTKSFTGVKVEVSKPNDCGLGRQYTRIELTYGDEKPPGENPLRVPFPCQK